MIDIHVSARYLEDQSQPANNKYVYSYTIRIENNGVESAKLESRYWHITDANSQVQEVQGLGVVGEQPNLQPGQSYTYTSGAILETSSGTMHGHYTMLKDDGSKFNAQIPVFALVQPLALH